MMDAGLAIEVAAKGALVLAAACVAYALMWRYAASQRHLVLAVAMLGVLMIPVFALVLPNVTMPVRATAIEKQAPLTAEASTIVSASPLRTTETSGAVPREPITASSVSQTMPETATSFSWMGFFTILWAAGFAASLLPLTIGLFGIRAVRRSGRTLTDPEWTGALRAARVGLGVATPVTLIESPRARVPMTWGILRSVIALPESAQDWSPQRRQVVLCHELAHIKRRDFLTQLIARVACAAHWFNPLSWWTLRAMSLERERACDDLVVESGVRAPDYADHLLQIVRDMRGASLTARTAIAMAGHSRLEQRVRALLDATQNRRTLSVGGRVATASAALACVAFVAMLQPTAVAEEAGADEDTKIVIRVSDDDDDNQQIRKKVRIRNRDGHEGRRNSHRGEQIETEHSWEGDHDLGEILEHVSEVLGDIDLGEIIENVTQTLEREDIQGHIERALEHIDDVDINGEIEKALEDLELSAEDIEELKNMDRHEIRREIRKARRELRNVDIDAHLDEALQHLEDIDIDAHLDETLRHLGDIDIDGHVGVALEQLSHLQNSPEWRESMEAVEEAIGEIDFEEIGEIVGKVLEDVDIEPIVEAALGKVDEIDVEALMDTLNEKIEDIEVIVEAESQVPALRAPSSQADIESMLEKDNLRRANLRQVKLNGMDLSGKNLRGARLAGADLREANLEGADLRDADLSGTNLREANLRNAKLGGALLDGTNLRDADLHGVILQGVDLSAADTRGAQLK